MENKIQKEANILIFNNIPIPSKQNNKNIDDTIMHVRLFEPYSGWEWYLSEYDPKTKMAFGYVKGAFNEWGYVYIPTLETQNVERDLYFKPLTFKNLKISLNKR